MRSPEDGCTYFCASCPIQREYSGPVIPENFSFLGETARDASRRLIVEPVVFFVSYVEGRIDCTEELIQLGNPDPDSIRGRRYLTLANSPEEIKKIGEALCANVAACDSPASVDGMTFCPALNKITLMQQGIR